MPLSKEERTNSKEILKDIEQNIKDRLDEIKDTLAERIAKYQGAKTDAEKAAIKEKVSKLEFKINNREYVESSNYIRDANINIRIQSPEQLAQEKKPGSFGAMNEQETEAMAATNPLTPLSAEQTAKSLGRALLMTGEKAKAIFPKVAGREDMKRALERKLKKLKADKPEMAAEVESFLGDDTFKDNTTWKKAPSEKPQLESRPIVKTNDDGKLEIRMQLPDGKAGEIIEKLAADAPQQKQGGAGMQNAQTAIGSKLTPENLATMKAVEQLLKQHQEAALTR